MGSPVVTLTLVNGSYEVTKKECKEGNVYAGALLIIITFLGVLGNAAVIFIITKLKEYKKTITNLYIIQLAIADLLFMISLPFQISEVYTGEFTYGNFACKCFQSFRDMSYFCSVLFLTVMSIDRWLAINYPTNNIAIKLRSKRSVYIISCFVWIISIGCVVRMFLESEVFGCRCSNSSYSSQNSITNITGFEELYEIENDPFDDLFDEFNETFENDTIIYEKDLIDDLEPETLSCSYGIGQRNRSIYKRFILAFLIPVIVIIICYYMILMKLRKQDRKCNSSSNTRKRVTKMVISLVTAFVSCWLPYQAYMLARVRGIALSDKACFTLHLAFTYLGYFNSVLNPFLYTFLGTNCRKKFLAFIGFKISFRQSSRSRSCSNNKKQTLLRQKHSPNEENASNSFATKQTALVIQGRTFQDECI